MSVPRAAVTKDHRLVGENNRSVFSPRSGGQKSAIEVSAGVVPSGGPETSLPASGGSRKSLASLGLQRHRPKLCLHHHIVFSSACSPLFSFIRTFVTGFRTHLNAG